MTLLNTVKRAYFAEILNPTPSMDNPPSVVIPPFYLFSKPTAFDNTFLKIKYRINTKVNSCGKVISSFRRLKTTLHCFL